MVTPPTREALRESAPGPTRRRLKSSFTKLRPVRGAGLPGVLWSLFFLRFQGLAEVKGRRVYRV